MVQKKVSLLVRCPHFNTCKSGIYLGWEKVSCLERGVLSSGARRVPISLSLFCRALRADGGGATTTLRASSSCHLARTNTAFTDKVRGRESARTELSLLPPPDVNSLSQLNWGGGGRPEDKLPAPPTTNKRRLSHPKRRSLSSDQVTIT